MSDSIDLVLPSKHYGPVSLPISTGAGPGQDARTSRLTRPQLDKWGAAPNTYRPNTKLLMDYVSDEPLAKLVSNMYFDDKTGRFVEYEGYKGEAPKTPMGKNHWYYDHVIPADSRGVTPASTIWEHELFRRPSRPEPKP